MALTNYPHEDPSPSPALSYASVEVPDISMAPHSPLTPALDFGSVPPISSSRPAPRLPRSFRHGTIEPYDEASESKRDTAVHSTILELWEASRRSSKFQQAMNTVSGKDNHPNLPAHHANPLPVPTVLTEAEYFDLHNPAIPNSVTTSLQIEMVDTLRFLSKHAMASTRREALLVAQVNNFGHLFDALADRITVLEDNIQDRVAESDARVRAIAASLADNSNLQATTENLHDMSSHHARNEHQQTELLMKHINSLESSVSLLKDQQAQVTKAVAYNNNYLKHLSSQLDGIESREPMPEDPYTGLVPPPPPPRSSLSASDVHAAVTSAVVPLKESISSITKEMTQFKANLCKAPSQTATQAQPPAVPPRSPLRQTVSVPQVTQGLFNSLSGGQQPPPPPPPSQDFLPRFASGVPIGNPDFFHKELRHISPAMLNVYARLISAARWGPIGKNGKNTSVGGKFSPAAKHAFLTNAINRAFGHGGCGYFPMPPTSECPVFTASETPKYYNWVVFSGIDGDRMRYQSDPTNPNLTTVWYPPGFEPKGPRSGAPSPSPQPTVLPIVHTPPNSQSTQPSEVYYEDLYPKPPLPPNPLPNAPGQWQTVTHSNTTKGKSVSFAQIVQEGNNTTAPSKPTIRSPPKDDRWMIRFPKNKHPIPANRFDPKIVTERINTECKGTYAVTAVFAQWTDAGNLVLKFTPTTSAKAIHYAANTILNMFATRDENNIPFKGIRFSKVVPWSKLVYRNVLLRPPLDPQVEADMMMALDEDVPKPIPLRPVWTEEALEEQVRLTHPVLKDIYFNQPPSWSKRPELYTMDEEYGNVVFTIDDPDGSIGDSIYNSSIHMMGREILPDFWQEKINPLQCARCWKFGSPHSNCKEVCQICASPKHTTPDHNKNCRACLNGNDKNLVLGPSWTCSHMRCPGCGMQDHIAGDPSCKGRSQAIAVARARKPNMHGQTILNMRRPRYPRPPPQNSRPFQQYQQQNRTQFASVTEEFANATSAPYPPQTDAEREQEHNANKAHLDSLQLAGPKFDIYAPLASTSASL